MNGLDHDERVARLRRALDEAASGRGRHIAILGEAGIGKSRVVAELAAQAAKAGWGILTGRSYESEQVLPFGPWIDALRTEKAPPGAGRSS